jgi:chromosome segregation protein
MPGRRSRLKELRLHGFKTFAEPTRFVFEPGVNAVIGPNGSGKSNMADAVRWVLGEQSNRSLRTRRADDVIFTGSQQRKPLGMAEAVLTLDNDDGWLPIDFSEVTIGRRAYRSGETEYLLNGARARLRDVVDLLAAGRLGANELVVVGQGTVDAALSLRPEERRQLFEEAAGVKTLQVHKNEALGRLARASDNLIRVADLLGELRPHVRRLALQARHQQEHDALRGRARGLVLEAHRRRERGLRAALGEARRRAASAEAELEAFRSAQVAGRATLEAAEAGYWAAEEAARTTAERRERTREARIRAESRAEALALRLEDLDAGIERDEEALAGVRRALEGPRPGAPDRDDRLRLGDKVAASRWEAAAADLASADGELLAAEEALAAARRRQSALVAEGMRRREAEASISARRQRLVDELGAAHAMAEDAAARLPPLREAVQSDARVAADASTRSAQAVAQSRDAHAAAESARRAATSQAERVAAAQAELDALRERLEGGERLGARLAAAGWPSLVDAMPAPDEAWAAIEAVVGGEVAEALLWQEGEEAPQIGDARGMARLLDRRTAPPSGERRAALAAIGGTRTLAEWVGGAAPSIFLRVAVAPDLGALVAGWQALPAGWCAVTREGDLADGRGLLALRGRADAPGGRAARQAARRRELAAELATLEGHYSVVARQAAQAVARAAAAQRDEAAAREALAAAEQAARRSATELQVAEVSAERAAREVSELSTALEAVERTTLPEAPLAADDENLDDLANASERARQRRAAAAEERDAARVAWEAARGAADELERRSRSILGERAGLEIRLAQLESELPARRAQREALRAEHETSRTAMRGAIDDDEAAARERTAAEADRERLRAELLRVDRELSGATARLGELERAAQQMADEVSRRDEALAGLARERALTLDSLGLDDNAAGESAANVAGGPDVAPSVELGNTGRPPGELSGDRALAEELGALDDLGLEAELRRVRRVLAQIGSVNPFAVEEHHEQAERLEELSGQEHDLQAAIASTRELIARLDADIAERFGAAFAAIGERFDAFVRLLFAGGSASLQLSDGEDADSPGGIEIVVRPPGKRLQRLTMLSGGERALTGVALLFAMLSVNPVPFCILDEVDAALDEANIGRFAEALRQLAETMDFVVITHNRATIEVADTIYGVTMTDAAVSRVVSLRLADLPVEVTA